MNRPTHNCKAPTNEVTTRRAFLKDGVLNLSVAGLFTLAARDLSGAETSPCRIGLITDLHYADKPAAGSRHYRETPKKLAEATEHFTNSGVNAVVELGDFIDAADSVDTELGYLKQIEKQFAQISKNRHYVLGNHCVHTLNKSEFLGVIEKEKSYYSFDLAGRHFVVLDACFRGDLQPYGRKNFEWTDPNIPPAEVEWLKDDLASTKLPTVVFAHQRLDVQNNYGVKNAEEVRKVLSESNRVAAVFQGHSHKNDHREIDGIHYCTLVAMVEGAGPENNGFSVLDWSTADKIKIDGFRHQQDYDWEAT